MSVRVRFAPGSTRGRQGGPLLTMGRASNYPEQATSPVDSPEARSASKESPNGSWAVYIVECCDRTLYVGATVDLARRVGKHNSKRGGNYTSSHGPVRLVYSESHPDASSALRREAQLKRWTRAKKLALVRASVHALRTLSRSHD